MKKQFPILLVACLAACQQQAPPTQVAAILLAAPVAAAKPVAVPAAAPTPAALPDSLTPAMQAMLRQINVATLFAAPPKPPTAAYQAILDGFFGTSPRRLSLAILRAAPDSVRPGLLHISGKVRYQQQISRFEGVIQLTDIADYYEQGMLLSQSSEVLKYVTDSNSQNGGYVANARAYSAAAAFRFQCNSPAGPTLTGRALLDFWATDKGETGFMSAPAEGQILEKAPTKGSGLVLKGNWQNAPGAIGKSFLVSTNIFLLSPDIIADFGVGDRGASVNPKYAHLGWDDYWRNDEWWAASPTPTLGL